MTEAKHQGENGNEEQELVYVAKAGNAIKIGVSKNPERRITQLNTGNSSEVKLETVIDELRNKGKTARDWETQIHEELDEYHLSGEWFGIEALSDLYDFIKTHDSDIELTERQSNALGVAFTLEGDIPDDLYQLDGRGGDVVDSFPQTKILETIMREYDLPHGVCEACTQIAFYHLSENEPACQACGTPK